MSTNPVLLLYAEDVIFLAALGQQDWLPEEREIFGQQYLATCWIPGAIPGLWGASASGVAYLYRPRAIPAPPPYAIDTLRSDGD